MSHLPRFCNSTQIGERNISGVLKWYSGLKINTAVAKVGRDLKK
jgi:hypothetical protein